MSWSDVYEMLLKKGYGCRSALARIRAASQNGIGPYEAWWVAFALPGIRTK